MLFKNDDIYQRNEKISKHILLCRVNTVTLNIDLT